MTFVADKFVADLVLLYAGGALRRDYVAEIVRQVCAMIAAGKVQGVQTKDILQSNLLFTTPHLVYKDGTTRPLKDVFPRDYFPVFLVQGESDLRSGEIAELFEANPGEFEVRGPRGERIRATTLEALTFTPANLASGTPTAVTAVANFTATDEIPVVAYEPPTNSLRSSLLSSATRGCAPRTTTTAPVLGPQAQETPFSAESKRLNKEWWIEFSKRCYGMLPSHDELGLPNQTCACHWSALPLDSDLD